jgi:Replication-relaxation
MDGAPTRHGTARRQGCEPALSDMDLRILGLLSHHRVLTQTQLAAISAGVPARTLRYRCNRLAKHGLLGRTRPYRERGSAPHHLWPTRRGEAMACGGPPPRGGERHEPNPLFLAHAAGLSEIYVALEESLPAGFKLTRFEREADAREPFETRVGREKHAIAPDVFIEIIDAEGRELPAFVELDMGSMSHRRLKRKAAGYAEYAKAGAWREPHRFCPALLFITTTEKRAHSFLMAMTRELDNDTTILTCSCDLARRLPRCVTEPRWLIDGYEKPVDLLDAMREARRPYDEEMARWQAQCREEEAERERLLYDPEALRSHLQRWRHRDWGIARLGGAAAAALAITLEEDGELGRVEREALTALGPMFADLLLPQLSEREPSATERQAFKALAHHRQAEQLERIDAIVQRFGEVPSLRKARQRIVDGEPLGKDDVRWLDDEIERDGESRTAQKCLREGYLAWREQEADRLVKAQGMLARLRTRPEDLFAQIDRRSLRRCGTCEEIAFPDPANARDFAKRHVATRCHYCGTGALAEIESSLNPDEGGWN